MATGRAHPGSTQTADWTLALPCIGSQNLPVGWSPQEIHEFRAQLLPQPQRGWLSCGCDGAQETAFPNAAAQGSEKEEKIQLQLWLPA